MENLQSTAESSSNPEDVKNIQTLAKGVLEIYEPPLTTIKTHLKELIANQETVQNMINAERHKLENLQNDAMLDAMLADIVTNREKLLLVSNAMTALHKKVQSLQKRASNVEKAAKTRAAARANQNKPSSNSSSSMRPDKQPSQSVSTQPPKQPENQQPSSTNNL